MVAPKWPGWWGIALAFWLAGCATTEEEAYFHDVRACANVFVSPIPSPIHKIAIMPFRAQTELIGISISDLFVTEMLRARRYELVERGQMAKVLSESELSLAGLSAARAAEVGHMLGADGVVIGTVDEYSTVAQHGHPYPVVGISVRLIDCGTGKVMWSADLAKRADSKDLTLPEQARSVAHAMVAGLYQHWQVQPIVDRGANRDAEIEVQLSPDQKILRTISPPGAAPVAPSLMPAPPVDFNTSDLGLREVVLTWKAPKEHTLAYRIERATTNKGPFTALATVAAEKCTYRDQGTKDQPLQDGTTYYYRLVAVAEHAESTPTAAKESLTAPPPEPPTQLRAETPAAQTVQLYWKASSAEPVARYAVERAGSEAKAAFTRIGETDKAEFHDGVALQAGASYTYRVMAINRVGAISQPTPIITIATRPPPAPVQNLTATSGEFRCVPITWKPSPEEDVARYELLRAGQDGKFSSLSSIPGRNSTSWLDGGTNPGKLADGTAYFYKIYDINAAGVIGTTTSMVKATTHGAPPIITGMQAAVTLPREIRLSWQASPDPLVTGYEIERSEGTDGSFGECAKIIGRSITVHVDRGEAKEATDRGTLKDGWPYRYRIRALNATKLPGVWSAACVARTKSLPLAPAKVTVTYGSGWIKLAWATPQPDIALYHIWKKGLKEPLGKSAQPEYRLRFSDLGRRSIITLTAVGQDGVESTPGLPLELEEPAPPVSQELVATTNGLREVVLHWRKPDDNAKNYRLERAQTSTGPFGCVAKVSPDDGEYRDAGLAQAPLADATVYFYRLVALAANGRESEASAAVQACTAPPPAPPPVVKAEPTAPRKLKVSWSASPSEGVEKYIIERAAAAAAEKFTKLIETKETTFEEGGTGKTDLQDDRQYLYRITTINRVGSVGKPSQPVAVTTQAPPAPPTEIKVVAFAPRAVRLTWVASKADWVVKHLIERASATDPEHFTKLAEVGDTIFSEGGSPQTDLHDSTKYLYRITAINRLGSHGAPSQSVAVTTQPPPVPPTEIKADACASRAVRLTWVASKADWVAKYIIERATATAPGEFVKQAEISDTTFSEGGSPQTDLRDSTKYLYRITAINRLGAVGPASPSVEVTTRPPPAAVGGFAAQSGGVRCVPLIWQPSPEADVVRYDLYRRDADDRAFEKIGQVEGRLKTTYLDGGRDPGNLADQHTYNYRIYAVNAVTAEGPASATITATTRGTPPAVMGFHAQACRPREIPLAWEISPDDKVIGYEILRQAPGEHSFTNLAEVARREQSTYVDRGGTRRSSALGQLTDDSEYNYQIIAFNTARVRAPPSTAVCVRTKPAPTTPQGLTATVQRVKEIKLTWRANPESDISAYVVEATDDAKGRFRELAHVAATVDTPTTVEKDLGDGAARVYRVKAVDRDTLESVWSTIVPGSTKALPTPPAGLKAQWENGGVSLTWSPASQPDIKNYKVWRKKFFGAELLAAVPNPPCILGGAQVGQSISVFVTAVDADGLESPRSAPLDVAAPAISGEQK